MEDSKNAEAGAAFPSVRVKEAITIYGEKIETISRKTSIVERRAVLENELEVANKELQDVKQQLASSIWQRDQISSELTGIKSSARDLESKLEMALGSLESTRVENERGRLELQSIKQKHLEDLQNVKHDVQDKLESCMLTCATALMQARQATATVRNARHNEPDATVKRTNEQDGILTEADKQQLALILDQEMAVLKQETVDLATAYIQVSTDLSNYKLEMQGTESSIKDVTHKLMETTESLDETKCELDRLTKELAATRNAGAVALLTLRAELEASAAAQLAEAKTSEFKALEELQKLQERLRCANSVDISETLREGINQVADDLFSSAKMEVDKLIGAGETLREMSLDVKEVKNLLLNRETEAHWKVSTSIAEASAARIREQHMMIRMDTMRAELEAARLAASQAAVLQKPPEARSRGEGNGRSRKMQEADGSAVFYSSKDVRKNKAMFAYLSKEQ